ncbi:unnamed protein product [Closterium sp. NIES-54]
MYALSVSAEGDCYRCVPPDPGIAAAALGASESGTLPSTAPAEALHTFTLDSGASRCFFRDSTTLTPLPAPVLVRLADPSGGPVMARSSTVLPCPAVPSGSLSGLHLLSFSMNLVSTAALQDAMVTTTTPGGQRVLICTCTRTGRHLATFTRRPGSSLYTLATEPSEVAVSAQVSASGQVAASCSCRLLWHQNLLWHHRLGHPSLPCLCGMHSRLLVSGLPRSLPPLPPSPAPPCLPCIEGRQRTAPHSSSFPPMSAPLQTLHMDVAVDSGAARGAMSEGAEPGGAASEGAETGGGEPGGLETGGAEPGGVATGSGELGGAEPEGIEPGGAASEGAESGGEEPQGAASSGGSAGASPRLSPHQLREWFVRRTRLWSGAAGAGGTGVAAGAGVNGGPTTTGPGGARTRGSGAAGTGGVGGAGAGDLKESSTPGAGGAGAGGVGVGDPGAGGTGIGGPGVGGAGAGGVGAVAPGGTVRPRLYFVPLLQQVLGAPPSAALTPPLLCPPPDQSQPPLQPASPLPTPSPYTEQSGGLTERHEHASCPVLPSSLPEVPDLESDRARAASPTVSRLLATSVTDPSFESAAASALVAELLDFAAACRLDYASALVAEHASASPPSVGGECALGTDVLEDRQEDFECLVSAVPRFASMLLAPEGDPDAPDILTPRSYAEAITGPYSSQWQAAMDAEMASWKSTGTYVDEVPPPGANIVDGMWIFRVKRPLGSPPAFKARYVARGFSQRQGVNHFQTFSPTPKMTTLRVLLHVATQRDYELHSLDFSTTFLQGSLHEEIWLRCPPGFTESFCS